MVLLDQRESQDRRVDDTEQQGALRENIGNGELEMLEIFKAPGFKDFSLEQWLAATPGRNVMEHLFQADK